jgi:hypothetical protein
MRALFRRAKAPEPDEPAIERPALGIHPWLDILALQQFILQQQLDVFRHVGKLYRLQRRLAACYLVMSVLWMTIAALHVCVLLPLLRR